MSLQQVTELDFEQEVLLSEVPVLVEFGATWCQPCKVVEPELVALASELAGKAKVVTVDVDKSRVIAGQLGVQSVPTFLVFHQGRPVGGKAGAMKKAQLLELLEPVMPRPAGALKPGEVAQLLQAGRVCMVDIRETPVYERAHIAGAIGIPSEQLAEKIAELMSLPLPPVLYCRAGQVAEKVAAELAGQGAPVSYLEGGVLGWEAEGNALVRPD